MPLFHACPDQKLSLFISESFTVLLPKYPNFSLIILTSPNFSSPLTAVGPDARLGAQVTAQSRDDRLSREVVLPGAGGQV